MSYICASVWPDSNYETSKKRHCWVQALSVFIANAFNWLLTTRFRLFSWFIFDNYISIGYKATSTDMKISSAPLPYTVYIFYWCYTAILNLKYYPLTYKKNLVSLNLHIGINSTCETSQPALLLFSFFIAQPSRHLGRRKAQ